MQSFHLTNTWMTPCFGKLTAVGWTDALVVVYHGVRVGIRVNDPDLIPVIRARMPEGGMPYDGQECDVIFSVLRARNSDAGALKEFHLVYHNHTKVGRSVVFEDILEQFDSFLLIAIGFLSEEDVFLHAGVVAWRDRAIIIPGRTHAGKSTLVAELVRAGAEYMSDECTVLRPDGLIGTLPKALTLREPGSDKNVAVDLNSLDGVERRSPLEPGLVVITRYHDGTRWEPRMAGQGETVLALLDNALAATRVPRTVVAACERLARAVPAFKAPRGEAAETANAIIAEMDRLIDASSAA